MFGRYAASHLAFILAASGFITGPASANEPVRALIEVSPLPPLGAAPVPSPTAPVPEAARPAREAPREAVRPGKTRMSGADLIAGANGAGFTPVALRSADQSPAILKLQVMLKRAHASPGVIDGYYGDNVAKAISAFEAMQGLPVNGILDAQVWSALESLDPSPPLVTYVIQPQDVAGPFVPDLPKDYAELAKLETLAYRNAAEALAEKFHMDEDVLRQINPDVTFTEAGATITVANVGKPASRKVARLVADKVKKQLFGYDAMGALVVSYPATIGSAAMPSPSGVHAVKAVAVNPEYWYRPKVNFQQGNNTQALRLPPGPNNPVGAVWIGLDKPTYGIHGTPEPSKIDKTNSHGCVRLTNWDAKELVRLVEPGVPVEFLEPEIVTGSVQGGVQ
ncbi:L,D-transpeptidase family protein [Microvirga pudoricolor]|uniref:L,D-transpeptidase family protein n=1 Tax=Microvirga pudoricolor TaxID=2778729 RepID=UPI0019529B2D|nr:L,D-transpeptidase [Microvirga pudoricolor]MBM6593228.1 L,D-transpeptidase family protein [Microvirga pudoricolor]